LRGRVGWGPRTLGVCVARPTRPRAARTPILRFQGRDARHHLDSNAGGAAGGDVGVAADEAHHAPAGSGEPNRHRVDFSAAAAVAIGPARTDDQLSRFTAREIEDVGADVVIEQDDVGRLQRAYGAQGQQFRIARTGAD